MATKTQKNPRRNLITLGPDSDPTARALVAELLVELGTGQTLEPETIIQIVETERSTLMSILHMAPLRKPYALALPANFLQEPHPIEAAKLFHAERSMKNTENKIEQIRGELDATERMYRHQQVVADAMRKQYETTRALAALKG